MGSSADLISYIENVKNEYNLTLKYTFNVYLLKELIEDVKEYSSKYSIILLDGEITRETYQRNYQLFYSHYDTKLVYEYGKLNTIYINAKPFITYGGRSLKMLLENCYPTMQMPKIIYDTEYYIKGDINNVSFKVRIPKIV
jgi:hypothetical protein